MKKRDAKASAKIKVLTSATGGVLVDHFVPKAEMHKVIQHNGKALSCYLMWTDCKENHNKFYVAQALQRQDGSFYLWTRYGRVGKDGVGTAEPLASQEQAIKEYEKKYNEKTKKGYTEVKMALGKSTSVEVKLEEEKKEAKKVDGPKSKLDDNLQSLISFIFNMQLIE